MKRAELPERIETERLVLRNRTLADAEAIFDFASRPEVSYPAGFPPVKTLEDEIHYLEHILPDRNEKDNLPAGYGIVVKGTDKVTRYGTTFQPGRFQTGSSCGKFSEHS